MKVSTWIAILPFVLTPAFASAADCHIEGQKVTLSGKVVAMTSTSAVGNRPYRYAALVLDKPICYRDAAFGNVSRATVLSLIPAQGGLEAGLAWVGRPITLKGSLSHVITGDQPPSPSDLLVYDVRPATSEDKGT